MLRQPSQSSTTSAPTGVISGLMIAIGCDGVSSSSSPTSSDATNNRSALVDLRRRQPDAVVLDHRLDHVVDELLDDRRS